MLPQLSITLLHKLQISCKEVNGSIGRKALR